ncbi:MAG: hypothetical protein IT379_08285 [Deltaproteobacteria bacterium]|nr:hypothetical protein [Deltaproteobacteria bacterium]
MTRARCILLSTVVAALAAGCGGDPVWTVRTTMIRVGAGAVDRLDLTMRTRDPDTRFPARMATTYEGGSITTAINPDGQLVVSIDGARVQAGLRDDGGSLVYEETFHGGDGEAGLVIMTGAVLRDGTLPITTSTETYANFPPQDEEVFEVTIQCMVAMDCSM